MIAKPWHIKDFRWRIKDGSSVSLWLDHWISGIPSLHMPNSEEHSTREMTTMADLIDKHTK